MNYHDRMPGYNPIITNTQKLPEGYDPYYLTLPANNCFTCVRECTNSGGSKIKEYCPFQDDSMCPYNESGLFDD